MKDQLGFYAQPKDEPEEAPYAPNRAERRAAAQHKARVKRRGRKAYARALKLEQQVDRHLRASGIDPDEVTE